MNGERVVPRIRRLVTGIIALILVGTVWVELLTARRMEIPAPSVDQGAPPLVPATASQVQVDFHLRLQALQDSLNANAPKKFDGIITDPTDALTEDNISWQVSLGHISLTPADGIIAFSVPFSGKATLSGRFGVKRRNKGLLGWVEKMFSESFTESPEVAGVVDGTLRPVFQPDWRIDPQLAVDVHLTKAETRLFGKVIKVSFRKQVAEHIRNEAAEFVAKLNAQVAADKTIQAGVAKGWTALHVVIAVHQSPKIWVSLTPETFGASDPMVTDDEVVLQVAASVRTAVQISDDKPAVAGSELPALSPVSGPRGAFSLSVPVALELNSFHNVSPETLALPDMIDTPAGKVRIKRLFLLGDAGALYLGVEIEARSGWFKRVEGTIYLAGTPVLDHSGHTLRIENIKYDVRTSDYLLKIADFLLQPTILVELQKHAVFDMSSVEGDLLTMANSEIEKLTGELPAGTQLVFKVAKVGVSTLLIDKGWLIVIATAEGPATVRVSGLDGVMRR